MLFAFLILIALVGCNGQVPPSPTVSPIDSPLAAPAPYEAPAAPSLTDPSLGGAMGRVLVRSTGQPMSGIAIYLGEQLPLEPGPEYAITFQQDSSPHTMLDADGFFVITDVKPGTYALVLWTPFGSQVIPDPNDATRELQVVIVSGQFTDLHDVGSDLP